MADFSAFPSLAVNAPQPANILDMAGKAAQLNQTMLQNTGMGLDQHYKRLGDLAKGAMDLLNPDGSVDPGSLQDYIKNQTVLGNITAEEATKLYLSVPNDPIKAGSMMRRLVGGVGDALSAITPHLIQQETGSGTVVSQDNPLAAGGANLKNIKFGMGPGAANAPVTYTDENGNTVIETAAQQAANLGGHPNPTITPANGTTNTPPAGNGFTQFGKPTPAPLHGVPAPDIITTTTLPANSLTASPPTAFSPQMATDAIRAAAPPNALVPTPAQTPPNAAGGNLLTPTAPPNALVPAPVPGPIVTPALTSAARTQTEKFFADDISGGSDPSIAQSMSNLDGISMASDESITSSGATWRATVQKALGVIGFVTPDGASQKDIFDKETQTLADSLGNGGSGTDASMLRKLNITPKSEMTPLAIKTTAAMIKGLLQWKVDLSRAANAWKTQGGHVDDYVSFRSDFIENHPSPLVLSLGSMPASQQGLILRHTATLPASEVEKFFSQYNAAYPNGLGR